MKMVLRVSDGLQACAVFGFDGDVVHCVSPGAENGVCQSRQIRSFFGCGLAMTTLFKL
jgi:hypothetical protein